MDRPSQDSIDATTNAWTAAGDRIRATFLPTLKALARNRDAMGTSLAQPSYDGDGRGGGELTAVEAAVQSRWRATDLERRALREYMAVDRAIGKLLDTMALIVGNDPTGDAALSESANDAGGFCVNCARHGVQSVRARSARCDACYVYRTRNGDDRPGELVLACHRRRVVVFDRRHRQAQRRDQHV